MTLFKGFLNRAASQVAHFGVINHPLRCQQKDLCAQNILIIAIQDNTCCDSGLLESVYCVVYYVITPTAPVTTLVLATYQVKVKSKSYFRIVLFWSLLTPEVNSWF